MTAYISNDLASPARSAFIETLSAEFTAQTGVGVYVYLTPVDINQLFKDYLKHHEPIQIFIKKQVKSILV